MEEFNKKEKSAEELLVDEVRGELLVEKEAQFKKRDSKEHYNKNYKYLDVSVVGVEEAKLWKKMKEIKNPDEYENLLNEFKFYRRKAIEVIDKDVSDGKYEPMMHPKNQFLTILANRINQMMGKFMDL